MKARVRKLGDIMAIEVEGEPKELAEFLIQLLPPLDEKEMSRILDKLAKKGGSGWHPDDLASEAEAPPTAKSGAKKGKPWLVWWNEDQSRIAFLNDFLKTWIPRYSEKQIGEQIELADKWLLEHPERRRPRSNLERFLRNWLNKGLGEGERG